MSHEDGRALLAATDTEHHPPGSVICRQGTEGRAVYLLERGRVAVMKEVEEGEPVMLGYRGAGEILGEMSLVSRQPRSASVVAVEDCDLLRIEADLFSALLKEHPGISWAVLSVLNDRLQEADEVRTNVLQEEQNLAQRVVRLTGEAERLAELARVRRETIQLVVHDLRTPLTVIDGCLQMLQISLTDQALASVSNILDLAERSSQRMMSLLEELLGAAYRETLGAEAVLEPVDVARLLQDAVAGARASAKGAHLALSLEAPAALPSFLGDRSQLHRVLSNLLDNAISYTPDGGSIVVGARHAGDHVEVSVTDSGPGVPKEHRELIFERFVRVPGIAGRRHGFGLGLYYCRQVIRAQGGRIWVEPAPGGVGSRFIFSLPIQGGNVHDSPA
ncbi:MAG: ATP-binding protein [Anaerolineae bacterium]